MQFWSAMQHPAEVFSNSEAEAVVLTAPAQTGFEHAHPTEAQSILFCLKFLCPQEVVHVLPVVPEAKEASQQYEALHTALHQFVEATHAEWYNGLEGSFAGALANSLLLQDKNQGGLLVMNFDKQLLKMLQEVCFLMQIPEILKRLMA